jgi:hypothetical protein
MVELGRARDASRIRNLNTRADYESYLRSIKDRDKDGKKRPRQGRSEGSLRPSSF